MTASACSAVVRTSAFLRAVAITQGHSVMCACHGVSDACPIATGEPRTPGRLAGSLVAMNDALERVRMVKEAGR